MKISMFYIIFLTLVISCSSKPNSHVMKLNRAIDYNWNITIEEIYRNFKEKQYSEIKLENDMITAKYDYNGLFSDYYFLFSNEKMYRGGISYLGFPDEEDVSDDGYTIDDIYNIQKNILKLLYEKYGDPQEVEEEKEDYTGEIRYYKWYFNNNCTLEYSMQIEYFILTACWIDVIFTNNNIQVEEKPVISGGNNQTDYPESSYGDFKYKKNKSETITITSYTGSDDVIIPSEIDGCSVASIGDRAFYRTQISSVIIPDTITSIGIHGLSYNQLTNLVIPDSVTSIEAYAFSGNELTSVIMPDHITKIGLSVFSNNKLTSFTIPKGVIYIGQSSFMSNQLTSINIPDGVSYIGLAAFAFNQLTSVIIPDGVTYIGSQTFEGNQLVNVKIGNSVETIGSYAFERNKLTSIIIPDSVRTIEYHAFSDNPLTTIIIGANVAIIDRDDGHYKGTGIPNNFDDFYIYNERKAGTYTYMDNQWVIVN